MDELELARVNLVLGERIKHERVVRIGTVAYANDLLVRHDTPQNVPSSPLLSRVQRRGKRLLFVQPR
jgi:hypothetical protein